MFPGAEAAPPDSAAIKSRRRLRALFPGAEAKQNGASTPFCQARELAHPRTRTLAARSQIFAEISDIRHLRLFPQRSPNRLIRLTRWSAACRMAAKCDLSHCRQD